MIFLSLLLTTIAIHAAEPAPIPDFPEYKEDIQKIYIKMTKPEEKPNDLNRNFLDLAAKKMNEVSHYVRTKKDELFKAQEARRKEFEVGAKKELDEWHLAHPKESASNFMREQGVRRQAFMQKMREEKGVLERNLEIKQTSFNKFIGTARNDFRTRFNAYVTTFNAATQPKPVNDSVKKEFKEIPKGKATVLAPDADKTK